MYNLYFVHIKRREKKNKKNKKNFEFFVNREVIPTHKNHFIW